ncbi:MAG TPA: tripartite tricarboxylate transporter substrate binding protein [Burkholderiales bacterium]|jgi:tripartite-type tricarboxylate transporter receptor subunit TctC|nr:tripartite tricarboxylate transporter substrate binding protein [Burkholderiales bacterium]
MSLSRLVAFLLSLSVSVAAFAQEWPSKPIKFVSPFPPGGSVDPLARVMAQKIGQSMKAQIIVENRVGASGVVGTSYVAKSPPDGYTWVFVFDTHAVNPFLNPNMPYDTLKDLAPVMLIATAPMAIATATGKPYKNFADIVAAAKAKDGVTIGSVGNGSLGHLFTILLSQASGAKLIHVPYKGGGPLTTDAMGGQVELAIASVAPISPHVRSGKLRGLATTGEKRSQNLPDVPTLGEQGVKGLSAVAWWGMLGSAGTPKPIIERMHAEMKKALDLPDVRKSLTEAQGMELVALSPEATQKFIAGEMQRWGKVVKDNNIRTD